MRVWKWALLLVVSLVLAILMYSFAQLVFLAIDNLWVQYDRALCIICKMV